MHCLAFEEIGKIDCMHIKQCRTDKYMTNSLSQEPPKKNKKKKEKKVILPSRRPSHVCRSKYLPMVVYRLTLLRFTRLTGREKNYSLYTTVSAILIRAISYQHITSQRLAAPSSSTKTFHDRTPPETCKFSLVKIPQRKPKRRLRGNFSFKQTAPADKLSRLFNTCHCPQGSRPIRC